MVTNPSWPRVLLIAGLWLSAGTIVAGAAPPATSLRGAMEEAVRALQADLFQARPAGRVLSVQGATELLVRFPDAAPPTDAEYTVVRPAAAGGGVFRQAVGHARIAEARGGMARAVLLWSEGALRPGDELVWPSRFTLLLLPAETEDSPELAGLGRHLNRWLELELLADRRLRVVRANQPAEERWRLKRFQEEREYALVIAPLLVAGSDGAQVILRASVDTQNRPVVDT